MWAKRCGGSLKVPLFLILCQIYVVYLSSHYSFCLVNAGLGTCRTWRLVLPLKPEISEIQLEDSTRMRLAQTCSTYGGDERCVLVRKPEGKRPLGRSSCRWEGNIKMDL
jgi:hypothetical protein